MRKRAMYKEKRIYFALDVISWVFGVVDEFVFLPPVWIVR